MGVLYDSIVKDRICFQAEYRNRKIFSHLYREKNGALHTSKNHFSNIFLIFAKMRIFLLWTALGYTPVISAYSRSVYSSK